MDWGTLSAGSLRITVPPFFLSVPRVLGRALSTTGRVVTAFLVGERGFTRLGGASGFCCVFLIGTASLTDGVRLSRAEGSVF